MIVWNNLTIANNSAASGITIAPIDSNTLGTKYLQAEKLTVKSGSKSAVLTATSLTVGSIKVDTLENTTSSTLKGKIEVSLTVGGSKESFLIAKPFGGSSKAGYVSADNSSGCSLHLEEFSAVYADLVHADRVAPTYLGNYNAKVSTAYIQNLGSSLYKVEKAYFSAAYATTASADTLIADKLGKMHNKVYMYIGQYKDDDNDAFVFLSGGKSGQSYTVNFTVGNLTRTSTCTFDADSHGVGKWSEISGKYGNDGRDYSNHMLHFDNFFTGATIAITVGGVRKFTGTLSKQKFVKRILVSDDGAALDYSIIMQNTNYMDVLVPTVYNNSDHYAVLFFTVCGDAWANGYTHVTYASGDNTGYRSLTSSGESYLNPCLPNPYYNNRATFVKASS